MEVLVLDAMKKVSGAGCRPQDNGWLKPKNQDGGYVDANIDVVPGGPVLTVRGGAKTGDVTTGFAVQARPNTTPTFSFGIQIKDPFNW